MLTAEDTARPVLSPDDDDWVPPGWGTDEENERDAAAFAAWTRTMRPQR